MSKKQRAKWRNWYENWKQIWRDPTVPLSVKAVLFNVHLYRSDEKGWYISERKMAKDLGISKGTASAAIDDAIKKGCLIASNGKERRRRKLRLSGFLRSPDRVSTKPKVWVSDKPSKYQSKYQSNNDLDISNKRTGKMDRPLSSGEIRKRIQEFKGRKSSSNP